MTTARTGSIAAICLIAAAFLTSPIVRGQAQGNGPSGPGQGKAGKAPGTVSIAPVDAGRPWGWATKAFMEDPDRQLYNTASELTRIMGHKNPDRFFCDPGETHTWAL